jgi:response regulator RpfG family c-di-GMP phosphodiesterase
VNQRTKELEQANASLERGLLESVRLLLGFLERRFPERANRCREVARWAGRLGARAGIPPELLRRMQVAALVHDIGLMGLPDSIVRQRPDNMPYAAQIQYEQHPIIGQSMLSAVEQLVEIATWIRHHHERWDGGGYPDRLSGPAIPLPSRLIALADGYLEAVGREGGTAPRWRSAQRAAGAFDPDLVELLAYEVGEMPTKPHRAESEVPMSELTPGMRLVAPIATARGVVLVKSGDTLTSELVTRIQALAAAGVLASMTVQATDCDRMPQ